MSVERANPHLDRYSVLNDEDTAAVFDVVLSEPRQLLSGNIDIGRVTLNDSDGRAITYYISKREGEYQVQSGVNSCWFNERVGLWDKDDGDNTSHRILNTIYFGYCSCYRIKRHFTRATWRTMKENDYTYEMLSRRQKFDAIRANPKQALRVLNNPRPKALAKIIHSACDEPCKSLAYKKGRSARCLNDDANKPMVDCLKALMLEDADLTVKVCCHLVIMFPNTYCELTDVLTRATARVSKFCSLRLIPPSKPSQENLFSSKLAFFLSGY